MKRYQKHIILIFFAVSQNIIAQDFIILTNGHSHNDYTRERPLFDALSYGFTSIEVDVFWYDGRMVVTHDAKSLDEKPTVQELYLDPLQEIIRENNGQVFKNDAVQLVLMVDLKSDKQATYLALMEIFKSYLDIIEWYDKGQLIPGPVKVVLTGEPPLDMIQNEPQRYFSVDGTAEQWGMGYPTSLMPRASTNYHNYFKWYGNGEMPKDELLKLRELVKLAHSKNRKIRFWGAPDKPEVWELLLDEGVDWINVDDLKGFSEFYKNWIVNN